MDSCNNRTHRRLDIDTPRLGYISAGRIDRIDCCIFHRLRGYIYKEIDRLERSEIEVKDYTKYKELYVLFLMPSIVFMFLLIILKKYLFRVRV